MTKKTIWFVEVCESGSKKVGFTCNHKLTYLSSHPKCSLSFKTTNYHCMTIFKRLHAGKQLKKVPTNKQTVYKWWCIHSRRWKREQKLRYKLTEIITQSEREHWTALHVPTFHEATVSFQLFRDGKRNEVWDNFFVVPYKWDFLDCCRVAHNSALRVPRIAA